MKKNAFTLIEVLTVIVLLVTISLIAIFSISTIVKQSGENLYQLQIDSVIDASRTYAISHVDNFSSTTQITICDLKRAGLLKDDFINPKTDEKFDDSLIIEITKSDSKTFSFNFDAETSMPNYACDLQGLGVTLIGDSPYYVSIGSEISIPGIKVVDGNGSELSEGIDFELTIEDNLVKSDNKYSKTGQYYRKYTINKNATDGKQFKTTITRIINVEDNTPPVITVSANRQITRLVGDIYNVPTCTATDNDRVVSCSVVNNYEGKSNIAGIYDVIYTARDASGNTNTFVITILVKAKNKNLIGYANLSEFTWTNQNVTMNIDALYDKNECGHYNISYNGYDWYTKEQAIEQEKNLISANGKYHLGIRYDMSQCPSLDQEHDYFDYEITNIDKEAPTFYKNTGTASNPIYESEANLRVSFSDGVKNKMVTKAKEVNGQTIEHKYYYANGTAILSNPTGAFDNISGVSTYVIYINGERQDSLEVVLSADGKYIVELMAIDFANNESTRVEAAVIIIDTVLPTCEFLYCTSNNECNNTNPAITGANVSYASGYRVQLEELTDFQTVNYKMTCLDNYYLGEDDELAIKNFEVDKIQILNESTDDPTIVSNVSNRETLGSTSNCVEEICTRKYSYMITINVGKAEVLNDYMFIRLRKDAIQDMAGNYNRNSGVSMDLRKLKP